MDNQEKEIQISSNGAVVFEASLGLAGIFFGWIFGLNVLQMAVFDPDDLLTGAAAVLPMILVLIIMNTVPLKSFIQIREFLDEFLMPSFRGAGIVYLFLLSLLTGIAEELLFRGFLQSTAVKYTGAPAGIAIVSLLFGITHFITPVYMIIASVMGAWLGFLFFYTENLLVPAVVHSLYNFIAFIYYIKIKKS